MTYYCAECCIGWWPYQAKEFGGACPKCGGGTKVKQEPGSLDAEAEFKIALDKRREADKRKENELAFAEYCEAWDANEADLLLASVLEDLKELPVAEPRRDLAT